MSNHCRASACAARMVGLEPHVILRTREAEADRLHGLVGNVLFERLVGATVWTCTPGSYGRFGSAALTARVAETLRADGTAKKPYVIPVGGSNGIGSWGYVEAVAELIDQMGGNMPEHVVLATGSGGTMAGLVLGIILAEEAGVLERAPTVHAVGVCDDPEYFYNTVSSIVTEMGYVPPEGQELMSVLRRTVKVYQGKGRGYGLSTPEELEFVRSVAVRTGLALDPVYTGKALHHFLNVVVKEEKEIFEGKTVLFWHTGGGLGLFDKVGELQRWEKEDDRNIGGHLDEVSPIRVVDMYKKS